MPVTVKSDFIAKMMHATFPFSGRRRSHGHPPREFIKFILYYLNV